MNREDVFNEMIECIEEFDECVVTLVDGEQYGISPATEYIGGEVGYYMSSELGNVMYSDIESICCDLLDLIVDNGIEIEEVTVD